MSWLVEITWVEKDKQPNPLWIPGMYVKEQHHPHVGKAFIPAPLPEAKRYSDEDAALAAIRRIGRSIEFATFAPLEEE